MEHSGGGDRAFLYLYVAILVGAAVMAFVLLGPPVQARAWVIFLGSAVVWLGLAILGPRELPVIIGYLSLPVALVSSVLAVVRFRRDARDR